MRKRAALLSGPPESKDVPFIQITALQEFGEILLADDLEIVGGDDLGSLVGVVRTEDQDALAVQQEGIQVGDADAFTGEELDGVGCLARTVVEFDCEDFAERDGHAGLLEDAVRPLRLGADDTADTIVGGIGDGGSDELDVLLLEEFQHFHESARLVLDEDGKLMDCHSVCRLVFLP